MLPRARSHMAEREGSVRYCSFSGGWASDNFQEVEGKLVDAMVEDAKERDEADDGGRCH